MITYWKNFGNSVIILLYLLPIFLFSCMSCVWNIRADIIIWAQAVIINIDSVYIFVYIFSYV